MHVVINALSSTSLSGKHVLLGHLAQLSAWTTNTHKYSVLYHDKNKDICLDIGNNVKWIKCPSYTSNWKGRVLWEIKMLPNILYKVKADILFSPSGSITPLINIPQVTLAQNPWSLVDDLNYDISSHVFKKIQKISYRNASKNADMIFFNSKFMRDAYRTNSGIEPKKYEILYQGINDTTYDFYDSLIKPQDKIDNSILCVSSMAPHKGVETLVMALKDIRSIYGIDGYLNLVGGWPNHSYKNKINQLLNTHNLTDYVNITDHVSDHDLHQYYSKSKVFCLMSKCESFGIPAVESQVFGTPVVSSNCCAIPEVCGEGGVFPDANDVSGTAKEIAKLLTDSSHWNHLSEKALTNASKFRWNLCSQPIMNMFDSI